MTAHLLDRPVWSTLATRHARFAIGDERARRFVDEADAAPARRSTFAAARDDEPASLAALAALARPDRALLLLQVDPITLPPALVATTTAPGVQMVLDQLADVPLDPDIVPLTPDDVPAMVELATLTRPGPFGPLSASLGHFFGIKDGTRLVAMAGERMKQPGFTEVSGVCTHPDARGRGLARSLSVQVARGILARGETPYLHAYATNTPAIRLYESLGFRLRREVEVATVSAR